jgi:UDP-N-acetyl-D-mannosaminuronate dehydrogenase
LTLHDPYITENNALTTDLVLTSSLSKIEKFDVVILAVGHDQFATIDPLKLLTDKGFGYDIKAYFDSHPRVYRL